MLKQASTAMQPSHASTDEYLSTLAGERVLYCPNRGNAGDALMALAAYQLFRKHTVEYAFIGPDHPLDDALKEMTVIYGGGGSLNEFFEGAARFVERFHRHAGRLIVLPQTIAGHTELLRSLDENVDLLCRDEVSFEYTRKTARRARVFLAHDLVFNLDVECTLAHRPAPKWLLPSRSRWIRNELELGIRILRKAILDRGSGYARVLNCFRGGPDRPDVAIPADNIDISALLARAERPEAMAHMVAYRFLRFISGFDTIHTNRLHVAIAAARLGRNVNMYPNSFYKNEAVYQFSLKDRFPRVTWMG